MELEINIPIWRKILLTPDEATNWITSAIL